MKMISTRNVIENIITELKSAEMDIVRRLNANRLKSVGPVRAAMNKASLYGLNFEKVLEKDVPRHLLLFFHLILTRRNDKYGRKEHIIITKGEYDHLVETPRARTFGAENVTLREPDAVVGEEGVTSGGSIMTEIAPGASEIAPGVMVVSNEIELEPRSAKKVIISQPRLMKNEIELEPIISQPRLMKNEIEIEPLPGARASGAVKKVIILRPKRLIKNEIELKPRAVKKAIISPPRLMENPIVVKRKPKRKVQKKNELKVCKVTFDHSFVSDIPHVKLPSEPFFNCDWQEDLEELYEIGDEMYEMFGDDFDSDVDDICDVPTTYSKYANFLRDHLANNKGSREMKDEIHNYVLRVFAETLHDIARDQRCPMRSFHKWLLGLPSVIKTDWKRLTKRHISSRDVDYYLKRELKREKKMRLDLEANAREQLERVQKRERERMEKNEHNERKRKQRAKR